MLYRLLYFGGPDDGADVLSPRPYECTRSPDGSTYAAAQEGDACLEWVSDDERIIRLHYVGKPTCELAEVERPRGPQ